MGGRHSQMSWSGQRALLDVREWSGGSPGSPGMVWSPIHLFGSGQEALTVGRDAFQMSGSGQKALPDVREWSGGPPG